MFDKEHVPVRFNKVEHRIMKKDDAEIGLVDLQCEISPFPPALAKELDPFVRSTLYTLNDAAVSDKLERVYFKLSVRPQQMAIRLAPDQPQASFVIDEAKVTSIYARRSKKSSGWTLVFTATCSPSSEHQLAQIVECYTKSRYVTFANAVPGLFDDMEREERKKKSPPVRGQSVSGDGAPATH